MTEWRVIPGYPDYEASDDGDIRRAKSQRVLNPMQNQTGHRFVRLNGKNKTVARMVFWAFNPDFDESDHYLVIRHTDDDPENDSLDNLEVYEKYDLIDEIEPYYWPGEPRGKASPNYGSVHKVSRAVPIRIIELNLTFPSAYAVMKWLDKNGYGLYATGYIYRIAKDSIQPIRGLHFERMPRP